MYPFFKPFLFLLSPEWAHQLTVTLLDIAAAFPPTRWVLRRWYCLEDINYFNRRVKVLGSEMTTFGSDYLNILKRHFF